MEQIQHFCHGDGSKQIPMDMGPDLFLDVWGQGSEECREGLLICHSQQSVLQLMEALHIRPHSTCLTKVPLLPPQLFHHYDEFKGCTHCCLEILLVIQRISLSQLNILQHLLSPSLSCTLHLVCHHCHMLLLWEIPDAHPTSTCLSHIRTPGTCALEYCIGGST